MFKMLIFFLQICCLSEFSVGKHNQNSDLIQGKIRNFTITSGNEPSKATNSAETFTNACALWTRYNYDGAPSINGFSAGISVTTNTTAYVGWGMYSSDRLPARIQIIKKIINAKPMTAGGYIPHASEIFVPFSEYLVVPDGCSCQWMAPLLASNHPNLIVTGDLKHNFAFGRKTFADGRVAITKVETFNKFKPFINQCYNPTITTELCNETATELLVCETTTSTANPPKIYFPTESCGMWSSIGMKFSAANAFNAGLSIASSATRNITAYVGRISMQDQVTVGRYQAEQIAGTYASFLSKEQNPNFSAQWLIVPENCTCRWVNPEKVMFRVGIVTSSDQNHNFMVGRKILVNGFVSISYVNNNAKNDVPLMKQWYADYNKKEISDFATEVLLCETLPPPEDACALWTRYNNDEAPSVNGFSAGISVTTNTTAYVGWGMFSFDRLPARIQITQSKNGTNPMTVGGYVPHASEIFVPFSEYLVVPDGCSCHWMIPSLASNHPGLIVTGDMKCNFAIGRKTFENGRVAITKVVLFGKSKPYLDQCYNPTLTTELCNETATELLVCESTAATTALPKINFPTEACGMWSSIGLPYLAAYYGFAAGVSYFDTFKALVGRKQQGVGLELIPARFFINETYIMNNDTKQYFEFGSQWLIVPENCTCSWVTPDQGRALKSLITVPDQAFNYMIGRKVFSNGKVSISRVNNANNSESLTIQWYASMYKNETKDNANEVLICETTSTPLNGCALWTRYNNDDAPSVNGFSAGISIISNTTAYVGMGMYGNWRQPARIQITGAIGGFSIWSKEIKINYAEYLVVPDGCTCSWLPPSIASNRAIILTGDPGVGFAVGRKTFADERVAISKVITFATNFDYMLQWYNPTSDTEVTNETATELLVCETNASTTNPPKIKLTTESCGMWSTIGMIDSAATNGFAVGLSIAKNKAYVGRGQRFNRYIAGRYQVEEPTGTFATFDGHEAIVNYGSQWLIVPQNCSCSWIAPDLAKDRKSLVTIPDYLHNFMIGRKNLSNDFISISRVNFKNNILQLYQQWYANLDKTEDSDIATEVLVCATP